MNRRFVALWQFLGDDRLLLIMLGAVAGVALQNLIVGRWLYFLFAMAVFFWLVRFHWKALAKPTAPLPPTVKIPSHLFDSKIDRDFVVWELNSQGVEVTE